MRNNKLLILAYVTLAVSLLVCGLSVYLILKSQANIKIQIRDSLQNELKKYNVPVNDKATLSELEVLAGVAKYCESNNECRGKDGTTIIPKDGKDALTIPGYTPVKNVDYFDGKDAEPCTTRQESNGVTLICPDGTTSFIANGTEGQRGTDGRGFERRCNSNKNRMEWRYVGDLGWQVEYKLAPGQVCG